MWGGGELVHTVAPHCPPLARRLNTVVAQMWPYCARMAAAWAADNVDALLEQNKPTWIRSIALHRFSVGEACPEVSGVKVYDSNKSEGDEVRGGGAHRSACAHECTSPPAPPPRSSSSSTLCGQASSTFPLSPSPCPAPRRAPARLTAACAAAHVPAADARPPPPHPRQALKFALVDKLLDVISNFIIVKAAVEHAMLHGRVRVTLRPLLNSPPLVGAVQVAFTEIPRFSFDLSGEWTRVCVGGGEWEAPAPARPTNRPNTHARAVYGGDVSLLPGLEAWCVAWTPAAGPAGWCGRLIPPACAAGCTA